MPMIRWRLGAVDLTPENDAPIGRNVLTLTDIRQTATYTCVASSDLGSIEHQAEVQVKGNSVPFDTLSILNVNKKLGFLIQKLPPYDICDRKYSFAILGRFWCSGACYRSI